MLFVVAVSDWINEMPVKAEQAELVSVGTVDDSIATCIRQARASLPTSTPAPPTPAPTAAPTTPLTATPNAAAARHAGVL